MHRGAEGRKTALSLSYQPQQEVEDGKGGTQKVQSFSPTPYASPGNQIAKYATQDPHGQTHSGITRERGVGDPHSPAQAENRFHGGRARLQKCQLAQTVRYRCGSHSSSQVHGTSGTLPAAIKPCH